MIKKLRVDHRLLHGQVAFSWTQAIGADCILIANDGIFQDAVKMAAIKMGKPAGVKLVIKTIQDSIDAIQKGVTEKYKLFIVVESVEDAISLCKSIDYKEINLGGTKAEENKTQYGKALFLTEEEKSLIRKMMDEGIYFNMQMIPAEKEVDMKSLL